MKTSYIFIILAVLLGFFGCSKYNSMATLDQGVKAKWADVENQYQRRSDLIPNLVATVKGAANFEQGTLTAVVEARAKATSIRVDPKDLSPEKLQEFQNAQGQLGAALGKLMSITENYPDLKSIQGFSDLRVQLEGCENRITVARKDFNDSVKDFKLLEQFKNDLQLKSCWLTRAGNLSGGEAQRVSLLRAMMSRPSVLLLDEPFSALDVELKDEARRLTLFMIQQLDIPTLLITHDRQDAQALGAHIVQIKNGRLV